MIHDTCCAASAVAAAVSAAIDGRSADDIIAIASAAARAAEPYRPATSTATVAEAIQAMYRSLSQTSDLLVDHLQVLELVPKRTIEIVPLAISLAVITRSAEVTTLVAANLGGDTDSVASIGAGIAGAMAPESVNTKWYHVVEEVNQHNLIALARRLAALEPR